MWRRPWGDIIAVECVIKDDESVFCVQRWSWRHPRGSDLLRMASFQNNIYHEKDDIRCVCVFDVFQRGFQGKCMI